MRAGGGRVIFSVMDSADRLNIELFPDRRNRYGTFGKDDYATAARTPDGTLAMAYVPTARSVTVDLPRALWREGRYPIRLVTAAPTGKKTRTTTGTLVVT